MRAGNIELLPVSLKRERHGHFFTFLDSKPDNDDILSFLLPDPDRLFEFGETIQSAWQSAATDKTVVNLGGKKYFLKRYNCLGIGYRLKNIFRNSRALKSWWAGWKFLELGLPTPTPIVCLEKRHFRSLDRAYLLLELLDGANSLLDIWNDLNGEQRRNVLVLLGNEIGKMHRFGLLHGDLNWRNILVRETFNAPEIFLVDLDGCRFFKKVSSELANRDMNHFFRDLQRKDTAEEERSYFMQAWKEKFYLTGNN
jgi:tRNA A-37 threonylcarbamoyl transferase component Bud32